EIRFNGIPSFDSLSDTLVECKRVLGRKGMLKILVPLAFFEEPKKPALGEFIQVTAASLFPELGVVEGNGLLRLLEELFPKSGVFETSLGEVTFWAMKS
ncbi:MAG: hypothetical protein ACFFCP_00455, partial [Promethearchaeota archaeon]